MSKVHIRRFLREAAAGSIYREKSFQLGTVSASANFPLCQAHRSAMYVEKVIVGVATAVAAAGDDYTYDVQNAGAGGAGTTSLFASPPTDAAGIPAFGSIEFTPDQNQEIAVGEHLRLVLTKGGGAPNLVSCVVTIVYRDDL